MNKPVMPTPQAADALWSVDSTGAVRLQASIEEATGKVYFPPVPDASPLASRFRPGRLGAEGVLYSYTIIHPGPKTGLRPFVLAYVDFKEKARVFGRLRLADETRRPELGMHLVVGLEDKPDGGQRYFFTEGAAND